MKVLSSLDLVILSQILFSFFLGGWIILGVRKPVPLGELIELDNL